MQSGIGPFSSTIKSRQINQCFDDINDHHKHCKPKDASTEIVHNMTVTRFHDHKTGSTKINCNQHDVADNVGHGADDRNDTDDRHNHGDFQNINQFLFHLIFHEDLLSSVPG